MGQTAVSASLALESVHFEEISNTVFQDKSVSQSITTYFQNSEPPIICYKYNKPIRNSIFNFNKLVSDLDIHANTPKS